METNKCDFCKEIKPVQRQYARVKNKHFDDNKQGRYSNFFYYCNDCGIEVSDGYHTFDELYDHRIMLWIKLCEAISEHKYVWASVKHSDGSTFGDWFVLGVNDKKGEQITYHIPARYWNDVCEFANILKKAPDFDGHSSRDVIDRLRGMDLKTL